MDMKKEYVPFRDPQEQGPVFRCPVCGREVYGLAGVCIYCQAYGDDAEANQ